ncbi:MAG: isoaspartyl peptidase/L-asparaginase [Calditrichaeota bacterium]|nr:MAG: isoaspartyl peptidase/L-asparaginase [Calditrichota bacterium]
MASRKFWHDLLFIGLILLVLGWEVSPLQAQSGKASSGDSPIAIVIHGGAGTIRRESMTAAMDSAYRAKLAEALQAGYAVLKKGGSSLDAVEAAIMVMEDSPLFNAGKGAVFTRAGTNEMDASIMDGKTLNAGAVGGVMHIKNPIHLARLVMEKTPHVLLVGEGAERFALAQGIALVPQAYFYTKRRWQSHLRGLERERARRQKQQKGGGTVGAVALDRQGNLAAGTSTGGLTNKMSGRIGDSPIIGAGTYANNRTCGVSGTGQGEYFIRLAIAHSISELMECQGLSVKEAAELVIMKKLTELGGSGGVIALDAHGRVAWPFNTEGMYRGYIGPDGKMVIKIYKDE